MVNVKQPFQEHKSKDKVAAARIIKPDQKKEGDRKHPVSPTSLEEEVQALRARNKILTNALKAIKETAAEEAEKHYDLVWFARNRCRYPNHDARKRIEEEHKEELEKLMTADGDYFHGMHSGFLAASRMFKQQADVLHINTFERGVVSEELLSAAQKHEDKIEKSRKEFPKLSVEVPPTK